MRDTIRCPSRIHLIIKRIDGQDLIEVQCRSNRCGAGRGVVVFHYWDLDTGELVDTKKYKSADEAIQKARV